MSLLWLGRPQFESVDAFYAARDPRRFSPEMDFGCWWWDGERAHSGQWQVSALQDTGEVYAVKLNATAPGGIPKDTVVLLGDVDAIPDVDYANVEKLLAGWEEVCGDARSLQWVLGKVPAPEGCAPATWRLGASLQGAHVHVSVWAGRQPGARGRCGTLVMGVEEWRAFVAAFVAGSPVGLVEVDEDPALAPDRAAA